MEKKPVNKKVYLIAGIVILAIGIALTVISETTGNVMILILFKALGFAGIAGGAATLASAFKKGSPKK